MSAGSDAIKVVLGTDGSDTAAAAVRFVAAFPFPAGTDVLLLGVAERGTPGAAGEVLESQAAQLRDAGLSVTTEVRTEAAAAAGILAAAEEHGADLIAVGSHGRAGFRRLLLGSVSNQVLQSAKRSVLLVRRPEQACPGGHPGPPALDGHPWRILVGFDGSAPSDAAVELCARLDLDDRSAVHLLMVLPMVTMFRQDIRQELDESWRQRIEAEKALLASAAGRLGQGRTAVTTALVEAGDVDRAILAAAEPFEADLIVLGHKGKGAIEKFLTGSVTREVAQHACRSVLVVR